MTGLPVCLLLYVRRVDSRLCIKSSGDGSAGNGAGWCTLGLAIFRGISFVRRSLLLRSCSPCGIRAAFLGDFWHTMAPKAEARPILGIGEWSTIGSDDVGQISWPTLLGMKGRLRLKSVATVTRQLMHWYVSAIGHNVSIGIQRRRWSLLGKSNHLFVSILNISRTQAFPCFTTHDLTLHKAGYRNIKMRLAASAGCEFHVGRTGAREFVPRPDLPEPLLLTNPHWKIDG